MGSRYNKSEGISRAAYFCVRESINSSFVFLSVLLPMCNLCLVFAYANA